MLKSSDTAHYYNFKLNLKFYELIDLFLFNKKNTLSTPLIKFESKGRVALDIAINQGQYSKQSLLFRLSPDPNYLKNKIPRSINYIKFICNNLFKKIYK